METQTIKTVGIISGASILAGAIVRFGFKNSILTTTIVMAATALTGVVAYKAYPSLFGEEPKSEFSKHRKGSKGNGKPLSCWCTNKGGNGEHKCPCGGHHGNI